MNFINCLNEPYLPMKENENGNIICLYIDDTICVGEKIMIEKLKKEIKQYVVTKEKGAVNEHVECMVKKVND